MTYRPRIALVQGDPTGIGPELMAKLLSLDGIQASARIVILSDLRVFERGCEIAQITHAPRVVTNWSEVDLDAAPLTLLDLRTEGVDQLPLAEVSKTGGEAVLNCYGEGLDACMDGRVDGLCFMPFNKEAMHAAGLGVEDETQWARLRTGHQGRVSEFNVIDGMWNARVTSHVPLKDVAGLLNEDVIVEAVELAHETLKSAGFPRPKVAVAALNPHAGDGGTIGREEIDIIRPAVEKAQAKQIACAGPFPSDTLYLKVRDGEYDCAVSMYHDQGQIALKLLGFKMGVSIHSGLPFPMGTPAHGTAFDIAGQNLADIEPARRAFEMVTTMAVSKATAA